MLFSSIFLLASTAFISISQGASLEARGGKGGRGSGHGSGNNGDPNCPSNPITTPVYQMTCNGGDYTYQHLAGYGFVRANATDKYHDTMSIGSANAISHWKKRRDGSYTAVFWGLPDRGWNTKGTLNYQPRVHKFDMTFTPNDDASPENPADPNIAFTYLDTILLTGPDGEPTTGLDPDLSGGLDFAGFSTLPAATYEGDGFGGEGPGGKRISLDPEGIFLTADGGFWISDEYGPGIYQFSASGQMKSSIRTVDALIPHRNGSVSFSAASAPIYDQDKEYVPEKPDYGRNNNQGFEGLTVSPDGKTLYVLLQSAAMQEGGTKGKERRHIRFLMYDISGRRNRHGKLKGEYVVELPVYVNGEGDQKVASQSEVHYISETQFLILPRDGDAGHGLEFDESKLRRVDVIDISKATNIAGMYDGAGESIETDTVGELKPTITPALSCPWIDFNINSELAKFGLHNGAPNDQGLLNEKWEGLSILPVNSDGDVDKDRKDEYFLFAAADNDFVTDNGFMNFGEYAYSEGLGVEVDHQVVVFEVELPRGSRPLIA